ncbi:hypothetical protein BD410DRAFT_800026 [Rickenella mellea]|uniref:Non-specific serine/threonine protein kinase n=1 Tax=Rickenella mellea TaxID=50990 RepID=A0A4Y7QGY0_9AGAM|nr:hypothetical protein BD410DRAFT_800026 [Rickenella mellea]
MTPVSHGPSGAIVRKAWVTVKDDSFWFSSIFWNRRLLILRDNTLSVHRDESSPAHTVIELGSIKAVERVDLTGHCLLVEHNEQNFYLSLKNDEELYDWNDDIYLRSPLNAIGNPTDFEHKEHIGFDPLTGSFSGTGVPEELLATSIHHPLDYDNDLDVLRDSIMRNRNRGKDGQFTYPPSIARSGEFSEINADPLIPQDASHSPFQASSETKKKNKTKKRLSRLFPAFCALFQRLRISASRSTSAHPYTPLPSAPGEDKGTGKNVDYGSMIRVNNGNNNAALYNEFIRYNQVVNSRPVARKQPALARWAVGACGVGTVWAIP